jgi:hypothetical protein
MLCFEDITFCTFYADCIHQYTCNRPLTSEVQEQAEKWWGKPNPPICTFLDKPKCHKER